MRAIKELGQNFLTDAGIAADIADLADLAVGDTVWEIGPGMGILSNAILQKVPYLTAFELDARFETPLLERFGNHIHLIMQDVLTADWEPLYPDFGTSLKLVANIPYQITSPLLGKLEKHSNRFECIVLMVQKEVANRLCAIPGKKDYGLLTIRMQLVFDIAKRIDVPRHFFDPIPKVDSAVIVMKPRQSMPHIPNPKALDHLLRMVFQHRRKTLYNNLIAAYGKEKAAQIAASGHIDLNRRGETLSEAEFILLSSLL